LTSKLEDFVGHANQYSDMDAFFPLKTIGSFIIDNRMNTPVVKWQFPKMKKVLSCDSGYYRNAMLKNNSNNIGFNTEVSSYTRVINDLSQLFSSSSSYSGTSEYYQVASQLIPEQKTVNPWLYFKIGNVPYSVEVNLPKGSWQAGHVYTYNLTVSFAGPKFNVIVKEYTSPFNTFEASI